MGRFKRTILLQHEKGYMFVTDEPHHYLLCALLAGIWVTGPCESSTDTVRGWRTGSDQLWWDSASVASTGGSFHREEWGKVSEVQKVMLFGSWLMVAICSPVNSTKLEGSGLLTCDADVSGWLVSWVSECQSRFIFWVKQLRASPLAAWPWRWSHNSSLKHGIYVPVDTV
jgi:hypothetical protein